MAGKSLSRKALSPSGNATVTSHCIDYVQRHFEVHETLYQGHHAGAVTCWRYAHPAHGLLGVLTRLRGAFPQRSRGCCLAFPLLLQLLRFSALTTQLQQIIRGRSAISDFSNGSCVTAHLQTCLPPEQAWQLQHRAIHNGPWSRHGDQSLSCNAFFHVVAISLLLRHVPACPAAPESAAAGLAARAAASQSHAADPHTPLHNLCIHPQHIELFLPNRQLASGSLSVT